MTEESADYRGLSSPDSSPEVVGDVASSFIPVIILGRPSGRLTATARWMRSRGHEVIEVGTPLEAIALLEERCQRRLLFVIGPIGGVSSGVPKSRRMLRLPAAS